MQYVEDWRTPITPQMGPYCSRIIKIRCGDFEWLDESEAWVVAVLPVIKIDRLCRVIALEPVRKVYLVNLAVMLIRVPSALGADENVAGFGVGGSRSGAASEILVPVAPTFSIIN